MQKIQIIENPLNYNWRTRKIERNIIYLIQTTVCKLFRTRFVKEEKRLVLVGGRPASWTTDFIAVNIWSNSSIW